MGPTWPQVGFKKAQDGLKMTHDGPKMAQHGPKMAQHGPKMAQDGILKRRCDNNIELTSPSSHFGGMSLAKSPFLSPQEA